MDRYRDFVPRWIKCGGDRVIAEHLCEENGFVDDAVLLIESESFGGSAWVLATIISSGFRSSEAVAGARCIRISFCPFCGEKPGEYEAFSRSARS